MRRLPRVVAVIAAMIMMPVLASMPAAAAMKCEAGYTGPDSNNMCTSVEKFTCEVENTNTVTIRDATNQNVASGTVTVDGSGNGGGAVSGSASNSNTVNYNVVIENGKPCLVSAVVPATEEPETPAEETPETPVQPTQKITPKALPVTSGSAAPVILASIGGFAVIAGIVVAYRRLHI